MFLMITKRQLGIIILVLSLLTIAGVVGVDVLGAGRWGGLGPLQQIGIGLGATAAVVGLILIRLGNRPA